MTPGQEGDAGLKIVRFADLPIPKPLDRSEAIPDGEITFERVLEEEPEVARIIGELGRYRSRKKKP
jgi:hypothetical protein